MTYSYFQSSHVKYVVNISTTLECGYVSSTMLNVIFTRVGVIL
jgi:hypothetical protein